ncbi:DNA translocase FtsK [Lachnospiraceae bacterium]|nr:DNA translocase FtsK [Lachnospiraceae bacterium]
MASRPENTKNKKRSGRSGKNTSSSPEVSFGSEVVLLVILAVCIVLFISNFGFGGFLGERVSVVSFGLFGMMAYIFPICFFIGAAFFISNRDNRIAIVKLAAGILFVAFLCLFVELVAGNGEYSVIKSFQYAAKHRSGGGALGGLLASLMCPAIGTAGTYVVDVIALIISMVLLTERSFLGGVRKSSRKVYNSAKEDAARRREEREQRREEQELLREEQALRRMDKKVEGVAFNTRIQPVSSRHSDNISELKLPLENEKAVSLDSAPVKEDLFTVKETPVIEEPVVVEKIHRKPKKSKKAEEKGEEPALSVQGIYAQTEEENLHAVEGTQEFNFQEPKGMRSLAHTEGPQEHTESVEQKMQELSASLGKDVQAFSVQDSIGDEAEIKHTQEAQSVDLCPASQGILPQGVQYRLPPVTLLKPGDPSRKDNRQHLHETAVQLQNILKNFGVNVTITDVSCGPSVTRYELQPELGVKVSKIVNLADDIKLNLAAADIRIEAPIPGKAAVGIEVPNKENVMVRFREMIESTDFQKHPSSICFTAGKDIGGQVVVADIAKMPHLLIAGATGSGKSVCINTIIMSILYKANPEDVKLILIDPKVVELSVYNGIPHLFIPVVTDPKKAAGALHWAVSEMTDRYQKFADYQVRDLKGYNQKVAAIEDVEDETKPKKLPQIVIVVDELADLMMVAPGDVEDAICRLAQLARAAGIHLIIATQRPSVDVITGLIKANMPSRIAFSVSSGVDSRTILDMNGAEKLLGNGDMLFYPQGYQKPLRVQGPFVSDQEVEAVVDFLKKQSTVVYNTEIEEKMNTVSISQGGTAGGGGSERDAYFVEAGKFVIEKEKGSIGMLQRMFKIGFNRAARIMDQLEEAGVVGPEEGTKPRKILMSLAEFEEYVDEYV